MAVTTKTWSEFIAGKPFPLKGYREYVAQWTFDGSFVELNKEYYNDFDQEITFAHVSDGIYTATVQGVEAANFPEIELICNDFSEGNSILYIDAQQQNTVRVRALDPSTGNFRNALDVPFAYVHFRMYPQS